jgi:hypothetical protein
MNMDASESTAPPAPDAKQLAAQEKARLVKAYYEAAEPADRKKLWNENPVLQQIFSAGNHS